MAVPYVTVKATRTITQNVEYSIAKDANYSSGSPVAVDAKVQAIIDLDTMVSGDTVEIRFYKGVNGGTQGVVIGPITLTGAQSQRWTMPEQFLAANWDITIKLTTATSRSIKFEVIQDIGDVNVASITAGVIAAASFAAGAITSTVLAANAITSSIIAAAAIGASQIATAAITATKFATDAIDANALAADAATEIRTGLATAAALATVQADTDDIQTRLPPALDGAGNIKAGVQTVVAGGLTAIADAAAAAVFAFIEEAGAPAGARSFLERQRIKWSVFAGKALGLTINTVSAETFRDAADSKNRATFALAVDGTRTPGTLDGT